MSSLAATLCYYCNSFFDECSVFPIGDSILVSTLQHLSPVDGNARIAWLLLQEFDSIDRTVSSTSENNLGGYSSNFDVNNE